MKIMGQTPHATNLRDLLLLRAEYGEKPLLIIRDRILTYADADRLSNIVANQLMKYGVRKGGRGRYIYVQLIRTSINLVWLC